LESAGHRLQTRHHRLHALVNAALAVKAPGFGDRKKEMLEDIAIVTGATVVSEQLGMKLENVTLKELGSGAARGGRQG